MPIGRAYLSTAGPHWRKAGRGSSSLVTHSDVVAAEDEAKSSRFSLVALLWVALLLPALATAGEAAGDRIVRFDISRQRADKALIEFAEQADVTFIFPADEARKVTANAVRGEFTPAAAIAKLLKGTGLQPRVQGNDALTVDANDSTADKGDTVKKRGLFASVIAALAGSAAVDGNADQATEAESRPTRLEEVKVTAQKREERLMDVPMSISAFTNQAMEDSGAVQLADFLARTPGLGIIDDQRGQISIQIRGIASLFGAAPIGYYLDELPFSLMENVLVPNARTYDLERVEVLRGPQGTLYGDGSIGGTIRILTREPDLSAWEANVDLSGSDTVDGEGSYAAKGMINLPIKKDVLGLRVVASIEEFGGWIDSTATGVKDENDRNVENYRAKLRFAPTDKLDVTFSAWGSQEDSFGGTTSLADRTRPIPPINRDTDYELYSATIRYEFPNFEFLSATSYMRYAEDALGTGFAFGSIIIQQAEDILSQELRLVSNASGVFRWTAGAFYRKQEEDVFFALPLFDIFAPSLSDSESYAVFGEGTWSVLDSKLEATLGLRYFEDDRLREASVDPAILALIQATNPSFTGRASASFDTFNQRFNLAFHPNKDWLLYANVAKGFRTGQVQPIASLVAAGLNEVPLPLGVDPETLWSYEVGTKAGLADGRVQLEGALFYNDWQDLQVNVLVDPRVSLVGLVNAGSARTVGVELGATLLPVEGLTLQLAGSHLSAEYTESVPGININDGDRVGNVPKTSVSAVATYRWPLTSWPLTSGLHGFIHGDVQYTSGRVDLVNSASPSGATTIADLRVGLEGKTWGVYAFVDNLTDEDGAMEVAFPVNLGAATRPRPRTYGVNVRFTFQ